MSFAAARQTMCNCSSGLTSQFSVIAWIKGTNTMGLDGKINTAASIDKDQTHLLHRPQIRP